MVSHEQLTVIRRHKISFPFKLVVKLAHSIFFLFSFLISNITFIKDKEREKYATHYHFTNKNVKFY